ncbi:MAG TPA: allantoate amidohydrolase [Acidimicrobiia bacterium]|nr:allantoate amidohydrolase [Acidimicrobiia bacterium]
MGVNELLAEIAGIGRDPETGGYRRFSFTPVDDELRRWFTAKAAERDLEVEADRNGNLWAWWGDPQADGAIATGSHLDSVPEGGAFDGPLGIASAFAAIDLLQNQRPQSQKPLAVVAFGEEEGSRFGVACLGSRLLSGAIAPDVARRLTDPEGVSFADAFTTAGHDAAQMGPDPTRAHGLDAFVELHIEQGRGLIDLDSPIAIGTSIWPHGRWRLDFAAKADHAGTTRMEDRTDPMPALAETVTAVTRSARQLGARATFGRIHLSPNASNAIPARLSAWLDLRAIDEATIWRVLEEVTADGISEESLTPAIAFDPGLVERMSVALGHPPRLPTAAGHDAGILAMGDIPTAMIYVRNPTGVSHSPREHATPQDCEAGVQALVKVLVELGV